MMKSKSAKNGVRDYNQFGMISSFVSSLTAQAETVGIALATQTESIRISLSQSESVGVSFTESKSVPKISKLYVGNY